MYVDKNFTKCFLVSSYYAKVFISLVERLLQQIILKCVSVKVLINTLEFYYTKMKDQ